SLGALYVRGAAIDWEGFDRGYARRKVALPTYPFQRQRYWVTAPSQPVKLDEWWKKADRERLTRRLAARTRLVDNELLDLIVHALQEEQLLESTGPSVEEVLYEVNWVLRPSPKTLHVANHTCRWIILADRTGLGSALAQQLEAFG
ncbi:MAG: hypothetical protein NTV69_07230, partial [Caldilinea sp.]|nr:hypothetical protein [Caldilinea sp.]